MIGWSKTREAAEEAARKLLSLRPLVRTSNLTDLWILTPDWLFFWLVRKFKLEAGLGWLLVDDEPRGGYIGPPIPQGVPTFRIHPGDYWISQEAVEKYGREFLDQLNAAPPA